MCIIAYFPKKSNVKEETIRTMFENNPDGAGLMWKESYDSPVRIRKGFFKVEDLIEAFNKIPASCERAIHCRIATAGKISTACCHPFPIRPKVDAMKAAEDSADMALMHNGVISYANPTQGIKANYSDSMNFAAKFLFPLRHQLDKECVQTLIEESTPSRLLIMREGADTIMLGSWKYDGGVYYSNTTYKPYVAPKFASYDWYKAYYGNQNYDDCRAYVDDFGYEEGDSLTTEYIILDIADEPFDNAKLKVSAALDAYPDIEYDIYKSGLAGELEIQAIGLPPKLEKIANFEVIERGMY